MILAYIARGGVPPSQTTFLTPDDCNLQVGRRLTINPQTETFVNDREADRYLTREYRQGFVVPARV